MNILTHLRILTHMLLLAGVSIPAWAQEAGWEGKWQAILAAAKKEGKVVVHGPADPTVRQQLPAKFTTRFGIPVEYLGGRGSDAGPRLRTERSAGLYTVDVFISGVDTMANIIHPEKMLDPIKPVLILPEVRDPGKWKKGAVWFVDPEGVYIPRVLYYVTRIFYVNTQYAKLEEFRSIKNLLDRKWKGKITTIDPTGVAGGTASYLSHFGDDFLRRFYIDQQPVLSRNQSQMTDWLARGTHPISFEARESEVEKFRQEGFPLDGVYNLPDAPGRLSAGFGSVGLMNKAPHPNAARLFLNWFLSKEGLETYSKAYRAPTTRNDVDESFLDHEAIPRPGVKYFFDSSDWEYITTGKEKIRFRMKEILGR